MRSGVLAGALALASFGALAAEPPEIAAPGATSLLVAHAVGAQIYECKADANGKLVWTFREPIAALMRDSKTIGRHFAGPHWEIEGSRVLAKAVAHAAGATAKDIPWLKLTVTERRGDGPLSAATIVRRLNTSGGVLEGACPTAGELIAEPYAADYEFLKD